MSLVFVNLRCRFFKLKYFSCVLNLNLISEIELFDEYATFNSGVSIEYTSRLFVDNFSLNFSISFLIQFFFPRSFYFSSFQIFRFFSLPIFFSKIGSISAICSNGAVFLLSFKFSILFELSIFNLQSYKKLLHFSTWIRKMKNGHFNFHSLTECYFQFKWRYESCPLRWLVPNWNRNCNQITLIVPKKLISLWVTRLQSPLLLALDWFMCICDLVIRFDI